MAIKYHPAPDIEDKAREICGKTGIFHDFTRIHFLRSKGSQSRRTIARCHTMPRILQSALQMKAHYIVEVISENFDHLNEKEKAKTIIHELLHIPKSMGGGFRHHDYVCHQNINEIYKNYTRNN